MKTQTNNHQRVTLAVGCFWCMEAVFEKQNVIIDVVSGYMSGTEKYHQNYSSNNKKDST